MKQEAQIFKTRNISLNEKKELMWNIIEPGDPYDIRKSMIASLPGQRKFMGPHLELVCLLQAAEIQRLCTFLEQYSLKIREQERVELDRHSYEVQIKQLTEKMALDEGFRLQNQKLKDFIRKQSKELEDLQRKPLNFEYAKKYEDSLRQLQLVIKENNELKVSLQKIQTESNVQYQQLRALEFSYQQQLEKNIQKASVQRGQRQYLEKERLNWQIERELTQKKTQDEINTFRLKCVELTNKLEVVQNSNRALKEQSQRFTIEKTKNQQLLHTMKQYQHRFELLATQIDRLNGCLRDKAKQLNQQYVRLKQVAEQKKAVEDINSQLQVKIRGLLAEVQKLQSQNKQIWLQRSNYEERQMLIHQYEQRMEKLSLQVERLNAVLRKKINELDDSRKKCRELELCVSNMQMVEKEVGDLRVKLSEFSKKIFQYEKQTTNQFHEIQRLNYTLKRMLDEINYAEVKLKNSQKQLQNQTKRSYQLESQLERQVGINQSNKRLKENYEESLRALKSQIQAKYAGDQIINNENIYLRSELNRQNNNLQELRNLINAQNLQLLEQKRSNQQFINKLAISQEYVFKSQAKIGTYQQQIKQLNEKIQEQRREPLRQSLEISRQSIESQLRQQIKGHQIEIIHLRQTVQRLQSKDNNAFNQLRQESLSKQEQINRLKVEIQSRQTHINDQLGHIQWLQNRCRELDQKIVNLLKDCQFFFGENSQLNNNINILQADYQYLQSQLLGQKKEGVIHYRTQPSSQSKYVSGGKDSQATGLKGQSPDYQLAKISREYEILKQEYQDLLAEHKKQKQTSADLTQQQKLLLSQNQGLKLKIEEQGEYYKKVLIFSQEIERLNGVLQAKDNQTKNTIIKLKQYEQKIRQLEQKVLQTNLELNNIRQGPGVASSNASLVSHYEAQIKSLREQLQSSLAANVDKQGQLSIYQAKIGVLGQQIERLNNILKLKVHQNDELTQAQLSLKNQREELLQKLKHSVGSNQMISLYEQKLTLMKSEIQRLNTILHQKVQSFTSLNDEYNSYRQNQELKSTSLSRQLAEYQFKINQVNEQLSLLRNRDSLKESSNPSILAEYQRKIVELSNQVDRLNRLLRGNGQRIEQLDQRDNNYLKEIERLNNALRIKVQECEFRNTKQNELLGQIRNLKQTLAQENLEKLSIAQNRDMFSEELVKAKQQMFNYQARIQDLYSQFQRLQVIMKALKDQNQIFKQNSSSLEQLIAKNRNLGAEIDRLNLIIAQRTEEVKQVRLALVGQATLERRITEDLSLVVVLFAEIQSLRLRVQIAESQSEQVRRSIASSNRV